jgi:ribonuclease HI
MGVRYDGRSVNCHQNWGMGGLSWTPTVQESSPNDNGHLEKPRGHINTKETIAVIETLMAVNAINTGACQLIVATDSETAIARLRGTCTNWRAS